MSRIRADRYTNRLGTGAPLFANGVNVTGNVGVGTTVPTSKLSVIGDMNVTGTVSVGGTLTYEDVTNIDSVGVITARGGLNVGPLTGIAATISTTGRILTNATDFPYRAQGALVSGARAFYVNNTNNSSGANYHFYGNNADGASFTVTTAGQGYFKGAVGINKSSPSSDAQLDVVGSSYWPILVKTTSTGGGGVAIKDKDDVTSLYAGSGGSAWLTGSAITDGLIRTQNNLLFAAGGNNERLRITSAGALNIGKGDESTNAANLVEMYVGGTDEAYGTIRGKYNRTNEFNRSELRFGVESNAAGKGFLALATGTNSATERLRITSAGNVSIGGMAANAFSNYRTLTIGGAGAVDGSGIDLERSDGNIYGRVFADANGLQIAVTQSGDYIRFETSGGTERARITSDGLTFNGDTAAANALDDYEEGIWTPTISGVSGSTVYRAYYIKVGRKVSVFLNTAISGNSNGLSFTLPFAGITSGYTGVSQGVEAVGSVMLYNASTPSSTYNVNVYCWGTTASLYASRTGMAWASLQGNQSGSSIILTATYVSV